MRQWVNTNAPEACHVNVVFMGWYLGGMRYAQQALEEAADEAKKNITFTYWSFEETRLENRLYYKNTSDIFWPQTTVLNDPIVQEYVETQGSDIKYRDSVNYKNKIFSTERRTQYELAMLKAGIKIRSFSAAPSANIKPLGYSKFPGFGFGSTVFSYRNCPNNNPLAFWWGNPKAFITHPFSKWYPLLQRNAYGS